MNPSAMLCKRMPLRPAVNVVCNVDRPTIIRRTVATFGTFSKPCSTTIRYVNSGLQTNSPSSAVQIKARDITRIRYNSTASPTIDTTSTTTATPASKPQLTWNRFLELRKQRRRLSLLASVLGGAGGLVVGAIVMTTQDIEALGQSVFGLDPIVVMGIGTMSFLGIGWLVGPFFGNALFNFFNRGLRTQIAAREREFYAKIKKYRVDPSSSSINNPVPDYYGEKIGSVADYRRWLKDQRAFILKRGKMQ